MTKKKTTLHLRNFWNLTLMFFQEKTLPLWFSGRSTSLPRLILNFWSRNTKTPRTTTCTCTNFLQPTRNLHTYKTMHSYLWISFYGLFRSFRADSCPWTTGTSKKTPKCSCWLCLFWISWIMRILPKRRSISIKKGPTSQLSPIMTLSTTNPLSL